jgi:CHAT domain-containing protein/Tfp pilus assembly protein PilF
MLRLLVQVGEQKLFGLRSLSGRSRGWAGLVIVATAVAVGQTGEVAMAQGTACKDLQPGVVVESVTKNSEGEKAGIAEGDVITGWSRGDLAGRILSPFDVSEVETEQEARGPVTLEGVRAGADHTWRMGPSRWLFESRLNFTDASLARYLDGLELIKSNRPQEAIAKWEAMAASQEDSCAGLRAWVLYRAARTAVKAEQWAASDALYQASIEQVPSAESGVRAILLGAWAGTFYLRDDWARAEDHYSQALTFAQEQGQATFRIASILGWLALVASGRGDLDKAEKYNHQALAMEQQLSPDSLSLAPTLNNLSSIARRRGDLVKAEDYLQHSVAIMQRLAPDSHMLASAIGNLGVLDADRGDLENAEVYYQKQLVLEQKFEPGSRYVGAVLMNLGDLELERGDMGKAEEYDRKALSILQTTAPDSLHVAVTLENLGALEKTRENLAEAEEYLKQALAICQKLAPHSVELATVLSDLGDVARKRHDLKMSEEYDRRALGIQKELAPESVDHAETLARLASALRDSGDLNESGKTYSEALDVFDQQMGMFGGSSDVRAGFRARHSNYYYEYADLLISQKHPQQAFNVMERAHSRTLLESLAEAHVDIKQGADPALIEKEHLLRATLEAKANRRIDLLSDGKKPERVAEVDKEIDGVLSEYRELEQQIRSTSPRYATLTQPIPLTAREVQQELLDSDTVLLEYILGDERSHVFVVTRNSLDAVELPKRSEIEGASRRVYELLITRKRFAAAEKPEQRRAALPNAEAEYQEAAQALSTMVLRPVAKSLEGKRLLIVADGALHYIPFGALPAPSGNVTQPGMPLIADHEVVNLPSASVLAVLRQEAAKRVDKPTKELAVLADPVFDKSDPRVEGVNSASKALEPPARPEIVSDPNAMSETSRDASSEHLTRSLDDVEGTRSGARLARLPFSRREAMAIMAVADPSESLEALDFQANRQTAARGGLGQYRIVHFATHGLLDNEHPELSGLVLSLVDAKGNAQDGFLDLEDVYNLDLPADLVVLSACETGLGKEISGEGLVGLTRGFMYAGASRVVASLWPVDDAATAELMGAFYRGMLKERLRPAAALRKAQQQLMQQKRWREPYYWAAFILQGDWN